MFRVPLLLSLLSLCIVPIVSQSQNLYYTLQTSFPQSATSIFRNLLKNAPDLYDALFDPTQRLTLFVPSDEAIMHSGIDINNLDTNFLSFIVKYHVINSTIYTSSFGNQTWMETVANDNMYDKRDGKGQLLDVRKDWHTKKVSLGYGVDTLAQGRAYLDPNYSNINASNGVIHSIDHLLLPPNLLSKTLAKLQLSKLIYASLKAAKPYNLVYNLDTLNNITFFAPTNIAFDEIYGKNIYKIKPQEWDDILELHIVPTQAIFSPSFKTGQLLPTLAGINLNVTVNKEGTFINDARVIQTDIITSNGVLHIIDHVFKPE